MTAHEQLRAAICRLIQQARESPVPPEWENQRGAKGLAFSLMLEIVGIENLERAARTGTDIHASDEAEALKRSRDAWNDMANDAIALNGRLLSERDGAQEQAAYWQRTANEFEQESIRDLAQRDRRIAELEAALERERKTKEEIAAAFYALHNKPAQTNREVSIRDLAGDVFDQYFRGTGHAHGALVSLVERALLESSVNDARRIAELEAAASLLVAKLGHRDGREFMARDASLEAHWKELRQLLVACAPAQPATATKCSCGRPSKHDNGWCGTVGDCGCARTRFPCEAAPPSPATRDATKHACGPDCVELNWGGNHAQCPSSAREAMRCRHCGARAGEDGLDMAVCTMGGAPHAWRHVLPRESDNSSNHEDADVCRCGSLMHRDGECDAAERVIVSARRVMELLGTRDGQSFMHRDAALHGHWKELRAAIAALDAAPGG